MTEPDETTPQLEPHPVEVLPSLVRISARAWLRAAGWTVGTGLGVAARLARAAVDADAATDLVVEVREDLRRYAREFLGIADLDEQVRLLMPPSATLSRRGRRNGQGDSESLRRIGAELLKQAADVNDNGATHPAYSRILTELAPDEARILRLLASDGPQPMVDVRATNLIGMGSQLVSQGLNMIGAQSGVRFRDRVPAYLNNLHRLGLIWLSDEPLKDPITYQVLEAQPDVLQAIKDTARAKSVQRSIRLSPFGQDFCDVCLPLKHEEMEELTAGEETA